MYIYARDVYAREANIFLYISLIIESYKIIRYTKCFGSYLLKLLSFV